MAHDLDLICAFMDKSINQENVTIRSHHLKAHTIFDNNQLLAKNEGLLATIHILKVPFCFVVKLRSCYWELVNSILLERGFIPDETRGNVEFYHYHHCQVPQTYEIYCTSPSELWRKWWMQRRQSKTSILTPDFLIRTRSSWYPVQDIQILKPTILIHTLGHNISLVERDVAVWLRKVGG
jgi:hypothetical protein